MKFTDAGGSVTIATRQDPDAGVVEMSVSDTGIGIPDNKIRHVTKPFEQVSNAFDRGHQGSGLGLSITKDLIEMHGGRLTLESRVGEGTCVTVRVPIRQSSAYTGEQE